MQWRKGGSGFKLPQDRPVNETVLPELGSSMDDTMSDRDGRRHFWVGKKRPNPDDSVLLAAD